MGRVNLTEINIQTTLLVLEITVKSDKSMPPPAKPLSREDLTSKVREFPVNYGASIVGITTVETLAGGPQLISLICLKEPDPR